MQLVIGAGEVGQAVAEVLSTAHDVFLRDVQMLGPSKADALHICFPHSDDFENYVVAYEHQYEPKLIVVHSTVPLGTCGDHGWVHSPVRGKHPRLAESIRTFQKFFAGGKAQEAARIFEECGVKTVVRPSSRDTEAGKMWELAQFGLAIYIEKHIYDYCQKHNLDFETVYTDFAVTYNAGYREMGDAQFIRPVLKHVPGPIGGHCVIPGSLLLNDSLADLVDFAGKEDLVNT